MASSGMLRRVALARTDISEAPSTSEMSVLARVTRRNIPEDAIVQGHRRENLISYMRKTAYQLHTHWYQKIKYILHD
jgi:hypothetical protein